MTQNSKSSAPSWEKVNWYVDLPEKVNDQKNSEKAAMGREIRRTYRSMFFHLGSDRYHVLARKSVGDLK